MRRWNICWSKAKYASKYFELHLAEEKISFWILEYMHQYRATIFIRKILLIMIVLRTWWRITWRNYTNRDFLRTSQKSTFCIETYCSVYEAILSSTWKEFDKAHVSQTATTESDDVVKLLKKTVLIIDKLNVACLCEQRLNCTKKARSILCDIEVKLQNNTSLAEQL